MSTTTYTVFAGTDEVTKASKKSKAVEAAQAYRDEHKVAVEVRTGAGTAVFSLDAPKKIKMSAPYTRVVQVPEEVVELIDGARVAYKRPRVGFALLDDGKGDYRIWDLKRGETVEVEVETTRDAGRWFADEAAAYRASLDA